MNAFTFLRLIWMIYGPGKVDLDKIQQMGLLAVKIGQVHALRLDFLPVEKCQKLAELYRNTIPIPGEELLSIVDKSNFSFIDIKPLASASVGQVHVGELKSGEKVVIKVVKQKFKNQFKKDVKSVRKFVNFILFFYPKLKKVFDPIGILHHIENYTLRELDLNNEIEGHEILKNIYEQNKDNFDLSKLKFPKIYKELSNKDIMVSEYVEGKTFDELLDDSSFYENLLKLFHIHGFYIFNIGTFHGDIHPGNLMLKDGNIYFIDTGAISRVKIKIQNGLFKFFEYLSVYDYENCAKWLNEMADVEISGKKFEKFKAKFFDLYKDFDNSSVSEVSLTTKMMQTIKLGVHSGMVFEKGMFGIIKSLMFLDGMVLRCNPDAILLKDMRKYINEFKERNVKELEELNVLKELKELV